MLDRKKLAVIHIVKKELDLSDEAYRDLLEQVAGVRSARDLDDRGFRKLMNHFARSRYYRLNRGGLTLRQKLFIEALRDDLGWDASHLENFLKKYHKKTDLLTLTKEEASNVIESLKAVKRHQESHRAEA